MRQRIEHLKKLTLPSHVKIVETTKCISMEHLQQTLQSVLSGGGEGLIARKPESLYISGFTQTILKIKVKKRKRQFHFQ